MSILNRFKKQKKEDVQRRKEVHPVRNIVSNGVQAPKTGSQHKSAFLVKQAWITEKAGDLSGLRKYIFIIDKKANKSEAKKAIESIYGVKVETVNTVNTKGKAKRLGRSLGRTSAFKKAIVTLGEGQKIDIMPT